MRAVAWRVPAVAIRLKASRRGRQSSIVTAPKSKAAAALPLVSGHRGMADFAADGQGMSVEFSKNQYRAAYTFAKIDEQKIVTFAMRGMMAQGQNAFFLD